MQTRILTLAAAIALSLTTVHAQTATPAKAPEAAKPAMAAVAAAATPARKIVTTASGLKYDDVKVGAGAEAKAGQNVSVHYTGWLWVDNKRGSKFDSSKDRGQPFDFPLGGGRVIKGWDEGVQGMKIGGTRILTIPPSIGYGDRGAGNVIPPGATLQFEVELLGVK
jgi:FKBP-type peptidyl-prolyl cis-trans isomerase